MLLLEFTIIDLCFFATDSEEHNRRHSASTWRISWLVAISGQYHDMYVWHGSDSCEASGQMRYWMYSRCECEGRCANIEIWDGGKCTYSACVWVYTHAMCEHELSKRHCCVCFLGEHVCKLMHILDICDVCRTCARTIVASIIFVQKSHTAMHRMKSIWIGAFGNVVA